MEEMEKMKEINTKEMGDMRAVLVVERTLNERNWE